MNNRYEEDYRFSKFRGVTGWLGFFLARICLGVALEAVMMLSIIPAAVIYASRLDVKIVFMIILCMLILCVGIAEIILFAQRNRLFVWLYLVMFAVNILSTFLMNTIAQGCLFVVVESAFIAYLLTSKNVAVRFSFYNKANRVALDAYAAKTQVSTLQEDVLGRIEELSDGYRRNKISVEEYTKQKLAFLRQL